MSPLGFVRIATGQSELPHLRQSNPFDGLAARGKGNNSAFLLASHRGEVCLLESVEQILSGLLGRFLQPLMGGNGFIRPPPWRRRGYPSGRSMTC